MNRKMVFYTIGQIILCEAILLLFPLVLSIVYHDNGFQGFAISAAICAVIGLLLILLFRTKNGTIYAKEGFVIVSFAWILMSLLGALPFTISGEIPNYIDAVFETVSGFTTTGASILTNVEVLSKSILMWRSFTHWVGGMGVLVFVMALLPNMTDRSIHIMRAEMPGPVVGKLVPKAKDTALILYKIYIVITLIEVILLLIGGMSLFDSFVHAFGTAGTGGFGIYNDSCGSFSPYIQWVLTIFMLIFGINFNLYYLILIKRFKDVFKSQELRGYLLIVITSIIVITCNISSLYQNFFTSFRTASFQVASIITTTGFSTADFNLWPALSKSIILILMFIGGMAGSTGGGLKVSRILIMIEMVKTELRQSLHPRSVNVVHFEGKKLDDSTSTSISRYFCIYVVLYVVFFLLICFEKDFDVFSNFTAVSACFNNIGPGLGMVGPSSNFANYSAFSKIVLSSAMLMGRLEIFPIVLSFSRSTWKNG